MWFDDYSEVEIEFRLKAGVFGPSLSENKARYKTPEKRGCVVNGVELRDPNIYFMFTLPVRPTARQLQQVRNMFWQLLDRLKGMGEDKRSHIYVNGRSSDVAGELALDFGRIIGASGFNGYIETKKSGLSWLKQQDPTLE